LTGGDDYELCFTVAQERLPEAQMRLVACGCVVTRIGTIHAGSGLRVRDEHGRTSDIDPAGYRHFQ
ncbi:MAG: thiamine-phosphate kinase, partial [Gammaproteobacteria bacterium]